MGRKPQRRLIAAKSGEPCFISVFAATAAIGLPFEVANR
jgi:hypothetical protein